MVGVRQEAARSEIKIAWILHIARKMREMNSEEFRAMIPDNPYILYCTSSCDHPIGWAMCYRILQLSRVGKPGSLLPGVLI